MAGETLQGVKVAILVTDGFEQVELTEPRQALDQTGADTAHRLSQGRRSARLKFHRLGPISAGRSLPARSSAADAAGAVGAGLLEFEDHLVDSEAVARVGADACDAAVAFGA
jgi:putative intracellular protease/amidase